ncbi:MAG: hypothetical protein JJ866_17740 [Roseibium sp.]|uniref:hypothetical protein n=1 Tax=Roseibium sp. TaxID=1936156 RepID=UPI001B1218F4|nr:hypothetical protein [Roseibium sp.]MBO6893787.1 hypothetical protein [Roseibium sp.]MBO6930256.1 hypothetical protein [Roseibium sp.]
MDEIILRRLRHLQRLEENHAAEFEKRFGPRSEDRTKEELRDLLSADWNSKRKSNPGKGVSDALPQGWQKEHWKTQQSMARDYAGVVVNTKQEALRALERYEAERTLPPAA